MKKEQSNLPGIQLSGCSDREEAFKGYPSGGNDEEFVHALARELFHDGVFLRGELSDEHKADRQGRLLLADLEDIVRRILLIGEQRERDILNKRRNEGIVAALERGVRFGRRPKPLPKNFENAWKLWAKGMLNLSEAARMCGMARTTFRSYAQARREKNQ